MVWAIRDSALLPRHSAQRHRLNRLSEISRRESNVGRKMLPDKRRAAGYYLPLLIPASGKSRVGKKKGTDPELSQLLRLVLAKLGKGCSGSSGSESEREEARVVGDCPTWSHVPPVLLSTSQVLN
ncbi:hypothetical protein NDU88_004648 [Pleurodeles waltl]|uniref:Uncharacterized protein n=1 Tax=Pleurodeles waltl TaxID=8319 RepID=A0AAV7NMW0_PLEWA|nr:hypothetical protein NDU88_004648 [Pleurodeles waltl]